MARTVNLRATASIRISGTAQLSVITYPEALLGAASELLNQAQYGISVVVSHMACEVATERALSASFAKRGVQFLEEAVLAFLNGYNLAADRNRKLYVALTGDPVHQQTFWQAFKDSAARRNDIMHRGAIAGRQDAEASFAAAKALVTHLMSRNI